MTTRGLLLRALALAMLPLLAHAGSRIDSMPAPPPKPGVMPGAVGLISDELTRPPSRAFSGGSLLDGAGAVGALYAEAGDDPHDCPYRPDGGDGDGFGLGISREGWRTRFEGDLTRGGRDGSARSGPGGSPPRLDPLDGFSSSDIEGWAEEYGGLASVWVDIAPASPVRPYLGGGIGAAQLSFRDTGVGTLDLEGSDVVLAWQLGAGLALDLSPNWAATLDYRWFEMESPSIGSGAADRAAGSGYRTHNMMAGMRLNF